MSQMILPSISDRERQVLRLIANEYTSREIASMLFISNHTVISHRKSMMTKWQVSNVAGLVRVGFQEGILQ
ncbi:MAG: helix-turn-helix transcriptional regulator [Bacteroidota bacterium]